jgi:hypothetical protein
MQRETQVKSKIFINPQKFTQANFTHNKKNTKNFSKLKPPKIHACNFIQKRTLSMFSGGGNESRHGPLLAHFLHCTTLKSRGGQNAQRQEKSNKLILFCMFALDTQLFCDVEKEF